MDLASSVREFFDNRKNIIDFGKRLLPRYPQTDAEIDSLLNAGYIEVGSTTFILLSEGRNGERVTQHFYRETPKGERALFFAQIPDKILNLPNAVTYKIDCFLHPD